MSQVSYPTEFARLEAVIPPEARTAGYYLRNLTRKANTDGAGWEVEAYIPRGQRDTRLEGVTIDALEDEIKAWLDRHQAPGIRRP